MGPGDFPTVVVKTAGTNLQPRTEIVRDAAALGFDRFVCGVPGLATGIGTAEMLSVLRESRERTIAARLPPQRAGRAKAGRRPGRDASRGRRPRCCRRKLSGC